MNLIICGDSATEYWRLDDPGDEGEYVPLDKLKPCVAAGCEYSRATHVPSKCVATASQLRLLKIMDTQVGDRIAMLHRPIHVMVPASRTQKERQSIVRHIWSGVLPRRAIRRICPDVGVATPEFCFLLAAGAIRTEEQGEGNDLPEPSTPRKRTETPGAQRKPENPASLREDCAKTPGERALARTRDTRVARLVAYGMELCGTYCHGSNGEPRYKMRPLTTAKRIGSFLEGCKGAYGVKLALRAAKYLVDGSASWMETSLYLLLCLPRKYGGYGLSRPVMNYRIDPERNKRSVTDRDYYLCDLYWPDKRVGVEYNGKADHSSDYDMKRAAEKSNSYTVMGNHVFVVRWWQVNRVESLELVVRQLCRELDARWTPVSTNFRICHNNLRRLVLPHISKWSDSRPGEE